jgi:hypothetical protein
MSLSFKCTSCGSNNTKFNLFEFKNKARHLQRECECGYKQYVVQCEAAKELMKSLPLTTRTDDPPGDQLSLF